MIFNFGDQTIDLFSETDYPDGPPDKILLGLSGGLDSSSLLYLILTYFPEIEVFIYCANDYHHPTDYLCAIDCAHYFLEKFPNSKLHEPFVFNFNRTDGEWMSLAKEDIDCGKVTGMSQAGHAKQLAVDSNVQKYQKEACADAVHITARTANPPIEIMKELGFYDHAEPRRNQETKHQTLFNNGTSYLPYVNVDKKFVAGIYHEFGLMDDLFPLTGSCVGSPADRLWNETPCGKCFWCNEKMWAFGQY